MKTVTVYAQDEESKRAVAFDDLNAEGRPTTIKDICAYPAVCMFFDTTAETIEGSLVEVNGNEVTEGIRGMMLTSVLEDETTLVFDLDCVDNKDGEGAQDNGAAEAEQPATGICTVWLSGGMQSVNLEIVPGQTTLSDVIHNDRVRARAGMSDAQLTACTVYVNDEEVPAAAIATRTVRHGDKINLSARPVHQKG